jgi:predicted nucleic acid-binding protein
LSVFADTSALYAILDDDDPTHLRALDTWRSLVRSTQLVTHSFVVVECVELVRRRLGREAVIDLTDGLLPIIDVVWVDQPLYASALEAARAAEWRESLVDHASFIVMRRAGIGLAFTYDSDFERAGFRFVPPPPRPRGHSVREELAPYDVHPPASLDLVGVAEISTRSGRPVSTVQSWRRRHPDFPAPSIDLAAGPIWLWSDVSGWIDQRSQRSATGSAT